MQAAAQSGAPSPRASVSSSGGLQPKSSSEHVPSSLLTVKSKKRERNDQNLESNKRDDSCKVEDCEMLVKKDQTKKADDILAIVDADGGLLNLAGVDKLVALMQQERSDTLKKVVDVASRRRILTGVIAATEKEDCLNRFVQLGGLPLLDDWLQEAHKGKFSDGENLKEGERICENLLLTLLCALDKLPVDLDALKSCIVGKSVNNLRGHKNVEVQRKARKLVDIWKRRVDAEMKSSVDTKPGPTQGVTWSSRQPQGDPLTSQLVRNGGPSDVSLKNSGVSSVKEEKRNPSPSQSIGPSWANAHVKGIMNICWKEDARNSSVASAKPSGPVFRSNRKGLIGGCNALGQKEISGGKTFGWSRNATNEKQNNVPEKSVAVTSPPEVSSNQMIVVRMPNPAHIPAAAVCAGPMVDSPALTTVSAPTMHERHGSSIPAETANDICRLQCNVQTEATSEAVSEIRSTSGKLKTLDGDNLQQGYEMLEKETDMNTAETSVLTAEYIYNRDENFTDSGKQVGCGNSGISSVSAQKISTESSSDIDCCQREDFATAAHAVVEIASPVTAASQDISHAESDSVRIAPSWGAVPGKKPLLSAIVSSSLSGDAFDNNLPCSKDLKMIRDADSSKELHTSDIRKAASTPVKCHERTISGVKTQGNDIVISPYSLPLGTSNGDCTNDFKREENMTHNVSSLEDKSELITAKRPGLMDSPAGRSVDTVEKVLYHDELISGPINEKRAGQGANDKTVAVEIFDGNPLHGESNSDNDRTCVALDVSLDRSCMSEEKPVSMLDELSEKLSKELMGEEEESTPVSMEDSQNDARQMVEGAEQKTQGHTIPGTGSSAKSDIRDGILTTVQETIEKTSDIFKLTRSTLFHESREKMKHEKNLSQMPQKIDVDSSNKERKLEEVSSVKSFNIAISDEVSLSYEDDTCRISQPGSKASDANFSYLTKYGIGSNAQHIVKSLQMASQTVGSSVQVVPSSLALSHDILRSSANLHAEDLFAPTWVVEKNPLRNKEPIFDLNEGLEDIQEDLAPVAMSSVSVISAPLVSFLASNHLATPVPVMASPSGTSVPPSSPLCFNKEFVRKGSAANSAFRPAEPLCAPERQQALIESTFADSHSGLTDKQVRPFVIDLNVMDDPSREELGLTTLGTRPFLMGISGHVVTPIVQLVSSVRLASDDQSSAQQLNSGYGGARTDLDLNRADCLDRVLDPKENCTTSPAIRNVVRDFDLNDGLIPSLEETGHTELVSEHIPSRSTGVHVISAVSALRMNQEMADVIPSWPLGNQFSAAAVPAYPGSRGDPPAYPISAAPPQFLNPGMCVTPVNDLLHRAGATPSTLAVAFPMAPPGYFPYSAFQFGAGGPSSSLAFSSSMFVDAALVSAFPSVTCQMVTHGAVAPALVRPPFFMSVPEPTSADSGGLSGRLNLDLNAGPEVADADSAIARHPCVLGAQPSVEDQSGAFRASGAAVKRKEPEGGLEVHRSESNHRWH